MFYSFFLIKIAEILNLKIMKKYRFVILGVGLVVGLALSATINVFAIRVPDAAAKDCEASDEDRCDTVIVTPSGNYIQTVYDARSL